MNNSLVLEIIREENQLAMSISDQRDLTSTLKYYSKLSLNFIEIDKLCQEVIAILNRANKSGSLETELIHNLKKTGQLLWDYLLTRNIKDKLRNTKVGDLVLSIDEELINIPWELLYDGDDFLCLKFNLGRLIRTKQRLIPPQYRSLTSKPKMLILANPTDDLKSAYLEGVYIKDQFDKKRDKISIDFKSTHIDTIYVKKNFRDYDIVHFAGHCEYDADNPKNSGWVLADGRFTTQDILLMSESLTLPTLVFSHACSSAQVAKEAMDIDYQEKTYSLASAFLFSGVRHYIGTIWKIQDQVSFTFAKEFYSRLISGGSVGECIRLARLRLIKEYGIKTIWWASYLLYGDPNFRLFKLKPNPAIPRLKRGISLSKKSLLRLSLAAPIISILIYLYMWLPTINPNTYVLYLMSHKLYLAGSNQDVISLSNQIIKNDPLFLAVYPKLADTYQRLGDRKKALKYYFDYALACEKRRDKKGLADAYIKLGWVYHLQGEYPRAFDFYNKALKLSQDNQDSLHTAVALRKLAVWYIDKEDYNRALELLTKSSQINQERQHNREHRYNLACDYFDIGLVFSNKEDFPTAKEFYIKSRKIFEKLKLKNELSDYYFNLGKIYLFEKQYQKAQDFYMKGLRLDQVQGNKPNIACDYNMLGELYVEMDNMDEAEKFFNQAILVSKQINARIELADAYYNLGLLYKQKGQIDKAKEYLRQSQEIYRFIDTPDYQEIKQELSSLD